MVSGSGKVILRAVDGGVEQKVVAKNAQLTMFGKVVHRASAVDKFFPVYREPDAERDSGKRKGEGGGGRRHKSAKLRWVASRTRSLRN